MNEWLEVNKLTITWFVWSYSTLVYSSVHSFRCSFCFSESIFTSAPYGAGCSYVTPALSLSSNICRVIQCSWITWQLCLLSRLNIMTPVSSVVSSYQSVVRCGWFAQKTATWFFNNWERNGRILSNSASHTWAGFGLFRLSSLVFFLVLTLRVIMCLTVSQAAVALQEAGWKDVYPMDFYSNQSLGPWAPNHPDNQPVRPTRRQVSRGGR